MSILIKDMEMPKEGCHHTICIYADGRVSTGGREYTAIPVPPHGDLIDRDALMKLEVLPSDNWVFRAIENAPTIIPAEEGE